ncbi:MAG: single-stranded DNA-binding protein [Tardiphaga sp.]|nr:single-stranded DNA-binding protein [Tardiphaga sp.]
MISLNKITLIGDLGADPESRAMPSGGTVCTIRLATTEKWKDKTSGEKMEHTEWHRVVFFGRSADVCMQYLSARETRSTSRVATGPTSTPTNRESRDIPRRFAVATRSSSRPRGARTAPRARHGQLRQRDSRKRTDSSRASATILTTTFRSDEHRAIQTREGVPSRERGKPRITTRR